MPLCIFNSLKFFTLKLFLPQLRHVIVYYLRTMTAVSCDYWNYFSAITVSDLNLDHWVNKSFKRILFFSVQMSQIRQKRPDIRMRFNGGIRMLSRRAPSSGIRKLSPNECLVFLARFCRWNMCISHFSRDALSFDFYTVGWTGGRVWCCLSDRSMLVTQTILDEYLDILFLNFSSKRVYDSTKHFVFL